MGSQRVRHNLATQQVNINFSRKLRGLTQLTVTDVLDKKHRMNKRAVPKDHEAPRSQEGSRGFFPGYE